MRFGIHGMTVESPVPLAASGAEPGTHVDLDLHVAPLAHDESWPKPLMGEVLAHAADAASDRCHTLVRTSSGWLLELTGTAQAFWRDDGPEVSLRHHGRTSQELLSVLLAGPVMTSVLLSRGHAPLHASAVKCEGGAVLLLGPPGTGKSTISRLLVEGGMGRLWSDDTTLVEMAGGVPLAHQGTLGTRLRSKALTSHVDRANRVGRSADGRITITDTLPVSSDAPLPVVAIAAPLLSPQLARVSVEPLTGARAALLVANSEALEGIVDPHVRARHFQHCAALSATGVPVVRIAVPWHGSDTNVTVLADQLVEAVVRTVRKRDGAPS